MKISPKDLGVAAFVVSFILLIGGLHLIYGLSYLIACGTGHTLGLFGIIPATLSWLDPSVVSGQVCTPGVTLTRTIAVIYIVVLVVAGIVGFTMWDAYQQSDKKLLKSLRYREGIAQGREVKQKLGRKNVEKKASKIRPTFKGVKAEDVGRCIGVSQGVEVWRSAEDTLVLFGPPRSGKGVSFVINDILDAPGAVVTTSTRGDNAAATWKLRAAGGRSVIFFDPQGITGVKSKFKWSPYRGCEDSFVAAQRATALVGASGLGKSSSNQEWAEVAQVILQYLLHAAALGKVPVAEFSKWCTAPDLAMKAVNILEQAPDAVPGWDKNLRAEIEGDPRTRQSKWMGVSGATSGLTLPSVRECFEVDEAAGEQWIDPEAFITSRGTLYLIGTRAGGGAVAPLLMALLDDIYTVGEKMANRSKGSRLDPPMLLELDEIANMAAWTNLPQAMSSGGGIGMSTTVVLQSAIQAKTQWGSDEGETILNSGNFLVQLGNSNEVDKLKQFVDLMGQRDIDQRTVQVGEQGVSYSDQKQLRNVIDANEIRRLPLGWSLTLPNIGRPVIMESKPYFKRDDADLIRQSQEEFVKMQKAAGANAGQLVEVGPMGDES